MAFEIDLLFGADVGDAGFFNSQGTHRMARDDQLGPPSGRGGFSGRFLMYFGNLHVDKSVEERVCFVGRNA
jgi:hypothetical protein